jgi:hypothetical protein
VLNNALTSEGGQQRMLLSGRDWLSLNDALQELVGAGYVR